jgi:hypothetical protein
VAESVKSSPTAGREYAANFVIAIHRALTMQLDFFALGV